MAPALLLATLDYHLPTHPWTHRTLRLQHYILAALVSLVLGIFA